jgi:transcriptional regulator with XRE-family HTH domain
VSKFGERIRELREKNNMLQRHVAARLDIDTPLLSKIERGERKAKREQVLVFSQLFNIEKEELLTLWLADQVYDIVKNEDVANKALDVAKHKIKGNKK